MEIIKALRPKQWIKNFIIFKRNLFSHKRKTLKNLLKKYDLKCTELDLTKRVEDISLHQLLSIFRKVNL